MKMSSMKRLELKNLALGTIVWVRVVVGGTQTSFGLVPPRISKINAEISLLFPLRWSFCMRKLSNNNQVIKADILNGYEIFATKRNLSWAKL